MRTNPEPQYQRAADSHDGNMAHLTSTETEKVSRQDCIGVEGSESKLSAEIKQLIAASTAQVFPPDVQEQICSKQARTPAH